MVIRYTGLQDDLLFDKPQVIAIVKTALRRLRSQKIQVEDIIHQIIQHGVQMTRSRFEDLFTSRPNRINGAPPSTIIALIHALFTLDRDILSAKEVLMLANAARLPIHMCEQLSMHFAHEEWRNAWFEYLPSTQTTFHRNYLIGRNREFSALLQILLQEQGHLIISGEMGIGKTVLAQTLIHELEVITGQNVTFVYHAEIIKSYAQFVSHLANALQIKPLHNEPIELRMASVLSIQKMRYVFIDNMDLDKQQSQISILNAFSQQFPKVRLIITTRHTQQFGQLRHAYEHVLAPLDDSQMSSPAMQLFVHMLSINGIDISNIDKATLLNICQRAAGNPQQINLLANMRIIHEAQAQSNTYTQLLDTLSVREFAVIQLLSEVRGPLSTTFLSFYMRQIDSAHNIQELVDRLINRGLITTIMIYSQKSLMVTHQLLDGNDVTQTLDTTILLRKLTQMARHIHVRDYHHITNQDIELITTLIDRLHNDTTYIDDVSNVLIAWQDLWMHANMTAMVISLIERCSVQFTNPNRTLVDLYLVNGRLHDYRGNTQSALLCLEQAVAALDQTHSVKWAEIMLDYVAIQSRQSIFPYTDALRIIDEVCAILQVEQHSYLLGIAYNLRAKTYATQNNLERAFTSSYSALQHFRGHDLSLGHIDALLQRSLIYMYAGDYDIANGILQGLIQQIRPYNLPYLMATAELRMAGVYALTRNIDIAHRYLLSAFQTLHRIGSAHEILMVADVFSLICYRQAQHDTAYIINKETSFLRDKLDLPRITYVERLVEDKRAKILTTISPDLTTLPVNITLYDLIDKLWRYLSDTHTA